FLLARRCADESPLLAIADIGPCTVPSALRCKADITLAACHAFAVGIGDKADMGLCAAHGCFWGGKRAPEGPKGSNPLRRSGRRVSALVRSRVSKPSVKWP